MFNGFPALHVVIYHGIALDYDFYPHSLFCFILVFITSCCTDFYSFVLCSSLLSTFSLTGPCPSPHYWVQCIQLYTWYFYHAHWADFPFLLFCFRLSFINIIPSFLPPTSLMSVFFCVSLPHRLEFLWSHSVSVQLHLTTTLPSIKPLCNNPIGWHHTTETFSLPTLFPI